MFITLTASSKKPVTVALNQCLKRQHFFKPRLNSSTTIVINTRRTFFNSSSSHSSSSSSFNFSAQANGHSSNTNDLNAVFKYNIGISYQPKDRESEKGTLYQHHQAEKPHAVLLSPTGEDNYLVAVNKQDGSVAIGVADGIGGWSEMGLDSSEISRELCKELQEEFETNSYNNNAKAVLVNAFDKVVKKGVVKVGGTTVCYGVIDKQGVLTSVNLGDSWFGVFRPTLISDDSNDVNFKCVFQSTDQTHGFNTPYQLSILPEDLLRESVRQGRKLLQDHPNDADVYSGFQLQKSDVVLFATDGVTDNVCPEDISIYLTDEFNTRRGKVDESVLLDISKKFVTKVNKLSKDAKYPSVFAQNLSKLIAQNYTGGKPDDITIVMLQVL